MKLIVGVLTVGASVASAQVEWSGSIQYPGSRAEDVRYAIPSAPSSQGFTITYGKRSAQATDVQFSGVSVLFRVTFGSNARCKLEAVPARGYAGSCVFERGDSATLTLIPPVAGMLIAEHEVAIARDAAPPHLASDVSVYVLGPTGYTQVVRGMSGITCYIERTTVSNVWPICHTREASEAIIPVEQLRASLRALGIAEAQIADSIARGYADGRFHPPAGGSLGYMLSPLAWTVTASGTRAYLGPHLHFYMPYATSTSAGVDSTPSGVLPVRVEREGNPVASYIVPIKPRKTP
jgi:hypothetical protein